MPSWTEDQERAINTFGGKIIVSAAAGSGKTAVLSQRVLRLILDGISVDELLIVTFTKAAAEEMKVRIKDRLKQEYLKTNDNKFLKDQISLIDIANITTMDAFYGKLVKDNFEKLGIDKDFDMLSNEEESILENDTLQDVLEDSFESVKGYKNMLEFFGANSINLVKDIVLKISSFLQTIPFSSSYLDKVLDNYNNNLYKDLLFKNVKENMEGYSLLYKEIINELYNETEDFDKVLNLAKTEYNYINSFLNINSFDELSRRIRSISFDTLRTPKNHKDDPIMVKYKLIRDEFKNEIRKNLNELCFITDEVYEKEQSNTLENIKVLFEVVNVYRNELLNKKKKINSYSFSDIAHFVIELLIKDGKKTNLANEITRKYKEILIDEYQDTNNMQNTIFNAISNDNLFIVGDVKQSIYRFRSACPEIFNSDKENANKNSFPRLITLSKNFRSRKEVLDFCNFIFENTMTNYFGEVNYNKDEMLYLGASFEPGENLNTEILLIDGKEKNEFDDDLTKVEKEAIVVADKIKYLIDSKIKIYDNKKRIWKNIKPSDIVILLRSLKNSEVFKEALNKRNISVYMESSLEYFDNYEVMFVINMLKVINNLYDDIALTSILTSPVINISYDKIADARSEYKYISIYEGLVKYNDEEINYYLDKIIQLKQKSKNIKISNLLTIIYNDFNVIPILSAYKVGIKRQKNLERMLKHAIDFENKNNVSLHLFITYLENVLLNKESLEGINPLSDGDNVLITTIHKSKGLEYPYVFLAETGKSFNFKDIRNDVMINEDLGFACNIKDNKYKLKYESIPMMIFKENDKRKMLSEELRILYVALTRAKEKLIISGFIPDLEKKVIDVSSKIGDDKVISQFYLKNVKCYLDIILACLLRHNDGKDLRNLSTVIPRIYPSESKINIEIKNASKIDESEFIERQIKDKVSFDMDHFNKIMNFNYDKYDIPRYVSVSEIKHNKSYLRNPNFLEDGISHTNLGTIYHKIFELLPIKKYSVNSLKYELNLMKDNNLISNEEISLINLEKIFAYLTSDLYDQILSADKVYKEYKIDFKIPSNYYDKNLKNGMILTSGIIDLMYVKDNNYVIVDYKTDNVDKLEDLIDLYKIQLDLYEIALRTKLNAQNVKKYIYSVKFNKYIEIGG